jgi:hypothetical protein
LDDHEHHWDAEAGAVFSGLRILRNDRGSAFPAASFTVAGLSLAGFGFGFLRPAEAQEVSRKVLARTAPSDPAKRMHVTGKVKVEVVIRSGRIGEVRHPDSRESCL